MNYAAEIEIYREAQLAAEMATRRYLQEYPNDWYPCGFAWVKIRPARGRFVDMCKDQGFGNTDDYAGGFVIYNPSENPTQSMAAKEKGAWAFCEVMKKHYPQMKISTQTRMD
jgi:hypothetical protein